MSKDHKKEFKEKKEKKILLWSLVIFFMVVIIFLWLVNLSPFAQTISEEEAHNSLNWQTFSEKLQTDWSNFRDDWQEVKDKAEREGKDIFAVSTSTDLENFSTSTKSKPLNQNASSTNLNELRQEIEDLNNRLKNSQCPEWINCMPTFSDNPQETRHCKVPPGCEGITQIAY